MLKAQFSKERLDGYGVAVGVEYANVKVPHPYNRGNVMQKTFAMTFRIWNRQFYFMVYKPAKILLTRKERRANHLN